MKCIRKCPSDQYIVYYDTREEKDVVMCQSICPKKFELFDKTLKRWVLRGKIYDDQPEVEEKSNTIYVKNFKKGVLKKCSKEEAQFEIPLLNLYSIV